MEVTAVDRFLLVWQTVEPITNISMFCFLFLLLQSSIKSQQIKPASWSRTSTQGPLTPYLYPEEQKLVMGRTQRWTLKHTPKKWVLKHSHCLLLSKKYNEVWECTCQQQMCSAISFRLIVAGPNHPYRLRGCPLVHYNLLRSCQEVRLP